MSEISEAQLVVSYIDIVIRTVFTLTVGFLIFKRGQF